MPGISLPPWSAWSLGGSTPCACSQRSISSISASWEACMRCAISFTLRLEARLGTQSVISIACEW